MAVQYFAMAVIADIVCETKAVYSCAISTLLNIIPENQALDTPPPDLTTTCR